MCQKLSIVCLALPVVTGCRRNIISYFLIFDRIFSFKKCNTVFMQYIYKYSFIHWYEIYEISHWDVSFLISKSNLSVAFGRHRKDLKTLIFQLFGYWNVCFHFYSDRDALKNAKYIIFAEAAVSKAHSYSRGHVRRWPGVIPRVPSIFSSLK